MTVRTRFAPSPTGYLHIGGARTALFNYLFARHHKRRSTCCASRTPTSERSTQEAVRPDPREPGLARPVARTSRRCSRPAARPATPRSRASCWRMGKAYLASSTPEELQRDARAGDGRGPPAPLRRPLARPRPGRGAARRQARASASRPRARARRWCTTWCRARCASRNTELDDMIILRSDGTPTYLHAVVVDDHDMGITHVIRGDDHLTNTFRQCMVYDAMGWHRPHFAHIPLIHGADGAKLSKRHGAVGVLEFREQGFLPEAVCNYLLRLGWGHGDEEIIPRDRAVEIFDIDGCRPRRVAHGLRQADAPQRRLSARRPTTTRLTREVLERLAKRGVLFGTDGADRVRAADARPEGAREDARGAGRRRRLRRA